MASTEFRTHLSELLVQQNTQDLIQSMEPRGRRVNFSSVKRSSSSPDLGYVYNPNAKSNKLSALSSEDARNTQKVGSFHSSSERKPSKQPRQDILETTYVVNKKSKPEQDSIQLTRAKDSSLKVLESISLSHTLCSFVSLDDYLKLVTTATIPDSLLVEIDGVPIRVKPHEKVPLGQIYLNQNFPCSSELLSLEVTNTKYPSYKEATLKLKLCSQVPDKFLPLRWNMQSKIIEQMETVLVGVPIKSQFCFHIELPYSVYVSDLPCDQASDRACSIRTPLWLKFEVEIVPKHKCQEEGRFMLAKEGIKIRLKPIGDEFEFFYGDKLPSNAICTQIESDAHGNNNFLRLTVDDYRKLRASIPTESLQVGTPLFVQTLSIDGCYAQYFAVPDERLTIAQANVIPFSQVYNSTFLVSAISKHDKYVTKVAVSLEWLHGYSNHSSLDTSDINLVKLVTEQLKTVPITLERKFHIWVSNNKLKELGVIEATVISYESTDQDQCICIFNERLPPVVTIDATPLYQTRKIEISVDAELIENGDIQNEVFSVAHNAFASIISTEDERILRSTVEKSKDDKDKDKDKDKYKNDTNYIVILINNKPHKAVAHQAVKQGQIIINPNFRGQFSSKTVKLTCLQSSKIREVKKVIVNLELDQFDAENLQFPLRYNQNSLLAEGLKRALSGVPVFVSSTFQYLVMFDQGQLRPKKEYGKPDQRFHHLSVKFSLEPEILQTEETVLPKGVKEKSIERGKNNDEELSAERESSKVTEIQNKKKFTGSETIVLSQEPDVVIVPVNKVEFEYFDEEWKPKHKLNISVYQDLDAMHNYLRMNDVQLKTLFPQVQASVQSGNVVYIECGNPRVRYYYFAIGRIYSDTKYGQVYHCCPPSDEPHLTHKVKVANVKQVPATEVKLKLSWHDFHLREHELEWEQIDTLIKEQLKTIPLQKHCPIYVWLNKLEKEFSQKNIIVVTVLSVTASSTDQSEEQVYLYTDETIIAYESPIEPSIISGKNVPACCPESAMKSLTKGLFGIDNEAKRVLEECIVRFHEQSAQRHILLYGAPGNGKSCFANNIMDTLGVPQENRHIESAASLLSFKFESTKKNLDSFFQTIKTGQLMTKHAISSGKKPVYYSLHAYLLNEFEGLVGYQSQLGYVGSMDQAIARDYFLQLLSPGSSGGVNYTPTNYILIATTNKKNAQFPAALIRDERFGFQIELKNPTQQQCIKMMRQMVACKPHVEFDMTDHELNYVANLMVAKNDSSSDVVSQFNGAAFKAKNAALSRDNAVKPPFKIIEKDMIDSIFPPEETKKQREYMLAEYPDHLGEYVMNQLEQKVFDDIKSDCDHISNRGGAGGLIIVQIDETTRVRAFSRKLIQDIDGFYHYHIIGQETYSSFSESAMCAYSAKAEVKSLIVIENFEWAMEMERKSRAESFVSKMVQTTVNRNDTSTAIIALVTEDSKSLLQRHGWQAPFAIHRLIYTVQDGDVLNYITKLYQCDLAMAKSVAEIFANCRSRRLFESLIQRWAKKDRKTGETTWDIEKLKQAYANSANWHVPVHTNVMFQ